MGIPYQGHYEPKITTFLITNTTNHPEVNGSRPKLCAVAPKMAELWLLYYLSGKGHFEPKISTFVIKNTIYPPEVNGSGPLLCAVGRVFIRGPDSWGIPDARMMGDPRSPIHDIPSPRPRQGLKSFFLDFP